MGQSEDDSLEYCRKLWNNWTPRDGKNQCENCPAHWSEREDYPGDPRTRESSFGHRPWYGDGDISETEVVILGHEPGPGSIGNEEAGDTNWTQQSFDDARNPDAADVPHGAGSLELTRPLFQTISSELPTYWTQAKKCNEITQGPQGVNGEAENQCVGIGEGNEGYLAEELGTIDPNYVIGLGTDVDRLLNSLYEIEKLGSPFSRQISAGSSKSGLRALTVEDADFVYIPTAHPSRGVPQMTTNQIEFEIPEGMSKSERYYQLLAEDIIEQTDSGEI